METKKIAIVILIILTVGTGAAFYYLFKDYYNSDIPEIPNIVSPSPESVIDAALDTDSDAVPDAVEKVIKTNPNKADTDGDTYNDLAEIKNGYSPLVVGSTKLSEEEWQTLKDKIKAADKEFYEKNFAIEKEPKTNNPDSSNLTVSPTPNQIATSFICGTTTVKDIDNNIYRTAQIGGQCWLKQNLRTGIQLATGNTTPSNNGTIEKWCPAPHGTSGTVDNLQYAANCATDGGLYQWNEAMGYVTAAGAQGICPAGWHIPTDAQQYTLENYLKDGANSCVSTRAGWDCDTAGTKLKVSGASGFEGILAGYRDTDGSFIDRLTYASLWSSSQYDASYAWERDLDLGNSTVPRYYYNKAYGFFVRCLKD